MSDENECGKVRKKTLSNGLILVTGVDRRKNGNRKLVFETNDSGRKTLSRRSGLGRDWLEDERNRKLTLNVRNLQRKKTNAETKRAVSGMVSCDWLINWSVETLP